MNADTLTPDGGVFHDESGRRGERLCDSVGVVFVDDKGKLLVHDWQRHKTMQTAP